MIPDEKVLLLIGAVMRYEKDHGAHRDGWTCFGPWLEKLDAETRLHASIWFSVDERYRRNPPSEGWLPVEAPVNARYADQFDWFQVPHTGGIMGIPKSTILKGVPS